MNKTLAALLVAFAASSAAPAFAAEQAAPAHHKAMHHHRQKAVAGHQCHEMPGMKPAISADKLPASVQAYIRGNEKMHREMMIDYTGNADVDFVKGMIAHHKGAVSMAQVELKYGKSPEMRAMAQRIIAAQKQEIGQMEAWLKSEHHAAKTEAKAEHKAAKKNHHHGKAKAESAKK